MKIKLFIYLNFILYVSFAQKGNFEPINLGDSINSSYGEISPILSPDEKTLYFIRVDHPDNFYGKENSQDIWFSKKKNDGTWSTAKRLDEFYNNGIYNAILGISNDGSQMLVSGLYTRSGRWYESGLTMLTLKDDKVVDRDKLFIAGSKEIFRSRTYNASFSRDGKSILIASSKSALSKNLDIYMSENKKGYWKRFRKIRSINKGGKSQEYPVLSLDGQTIFFSSNKAGGVGSFDIFFSKKTGPSFQDWGTPQLLESKANSEFYDSYFYPSNKLNYAIYASNKGAKGGSDLYKIKLKEEKPYVEVVGYVYNSFTGALFKKKKDFAIQVDGLPKDSVKIKYDSSKFEIHFPFGKSYKVIPKYDYYIGDTLKLDYSQVKEYTKEEKNLYLDPYKYVSVKGYMVESISGVLINYDNKTQLFLNDTRLDSVVGLKYKVDLLKSSYQMNLQWGKDYKIQFKSPKYITQSDTINLTSINEYQEIEKKLLGDKIIEKVVVEVFMATVTGKIINKKTQKPIINNPNISVIVDQIPNPDFMINQTTGEYTLVLPLSKSYGINSKLDKYIATSELVDLTNEKTKIKVIKDLLLSPIEVGQAIRMNNIFFQSGKAILDPKSFPELDKFAQILKDNPGIKVEIAGHTDNVGKKDKNMQLSRWRARSVEQYLEKKGLPADQVTFNGYGDTKPVADNKTPKGKALNRRVEFVIKEILP